MEEGYGGQVGDVDTIKISVGEKRKLEFSKQTNLKVTSFEGDFLKLNPSQRHI